MSFISYILCFSLLFMSNVPSIVNRTIQPTFSDVETENYVEASQAIQEMPSVVDISDKVIVENIKTGKAVEMNLEEYVCHVLEGEMPSYYDLEALKAGAVCARTYTVYKMNDGSHLNADVCTNSSHCQAFSYSDEINDKIKQAVYDTKGEIVTYNDEPILALYHASSFGATESCDNVFVSSLPYLISVDNCIETMDNCVKSTSIFNDNEVINIMSNNGYNIGKDFTVRLNKRGNRVDTAEFYSNGNTILIKGTKVRKIFGLKSTCFDLMRENGECTFNVYGFGHGVGLSQNGANEMAKTGKCYREILLGYYSGCAISKSNE